MSPKKIEIIGMIVALSAYYQQEFKDNVIAMYAEDLEDLDLESLRREFHAYRRDPKNTRFPLPAQIRARISPTQTDEGEAHEAAARIAQAISKFGWVNPEPARKFIGELGWLVVARDGGWRTVCETLDRDNIGILKSQWKALALTLHGRAKAGVIEEAPALPSPAIKTKSDESGLIDFNALVASVKRDTV